VKGFFLGFLCWMDQSALFFLAGRSSKFLQFYAVVQLCRGKLLLFCKYVDRFSFSSDLILLLDFVNMVRLLLEY